MMYILIFLNLAVDICGKFLVYFQNTFESVRLKVYLYPNNKSTNLCIPRPQFLKKQLNQSVAQTLHECLAYWSQGFETFWGPYMAQEAIG